MLKLIIISILTVSMGIAYASQWPDIDLLRRTCLPNGFTTHTSCSTCQYYKENKLRSLCLACCYGDPNGFKPYPKGELEICKCKFDVYPQWEAFIKSDERRSKHPNLSIIYSNITEPWLYLLKKNRRREIIKNIGTWGADRIDKDLSRLIVH